MQLKKCPFCGTTAVMGNSPALPNYPYTTYYVGCPNSACLADGPRCRSDEGGKDKAAQRWNQRVENVD